MQRLDQPFQQFLRERTNVNNVTASTREWYETAWKAFRAAHSNGPERTASAPLIAKSDLQHFVVHLRERGLKPVTCNTWIRALNACCRWLHEQGELSALGRLAPLRVEIPLQMWLTVLLTWLEAEQRDVIAFLREENRVLKAQLGRRRSTLMVS